MLVNTLRKFIPFRLRNWVGLRSSKYATRLPLLGPLYLEAMWGVKILRRRGSDLVIFCEGDYILAPWDSLPAYINVEVDKVYGKEPWPKLGDTVIDVGAYVGISPLHFLRRVGSLGKVVAVEPLPENLRYLRLNLRGKKNTIIVDKALSDKEGEKPLYLGRLHAGFLPYKSQRSIIVRTTTLDQVLDSLKIYEGIVLKLNTAFSFNLEILRGASATLSRPSTKVMLYCPYEVLDLYGRGSSLFTIKDLLVGFGYRIKVEGVCLYAEK